MTVPHTPGPWTVTYLDKNGQSIVKAEHIEVCTCWHHCVGSIEREMHANARLIAAAPDLLEALEHLMSWQVKNVDRWHNNAYDNAARVVKKATGETK